MKVSIILCRQHQRGDEQAERRTECKTEDTDHCVFSPPIFDGPGVLKRPLIYSCSGSGAGAGVISGKAPMHSLMIFLPCAVSSVTVAMTRVELPE